MDFPYFLQMQGR